MSRQKKHEKFSVLVGIWEGERERAKRTQFSKTSWTQLRPSSARSQPLVSSAAVGFLRSGAFAPRKLAGTISDCLGLEKPGKGNGPAKEGSRSYEPKKQDRDLRKEEEKKRIKESEKEKMKTQELVFFVQLRHAHNSSQRSLHYLFACVVFDDTLIRLT